MTKSGIGTPAAPGTTAGTPSGGHHHHHHQQQNASSNGGTGTAASSSTTTTTTTANAEIPIWIADKKKWVTGISKKTTINDLVYAILKQCQLVQASSSSSDPNYQQQYAQIIAQFVLVEYTFDSSGNGGAEKASSAAVNSDVPPLSYPTPQANMSLVSQRILAGDTKVYKYLGKWSQYPAHPTAAAGAAGSNSATNNHCSNLILKILQRSAASSEPLAVATTPANSEPETAGMSQHHSGTSLATKLLKKFGVSSATGASSGAAKSSSSSQLAQSFKFVDVKLPQPAAPLSVSTTTPSNGAASSGKAGGAAGAGGGQFNQHSALPRPHQHNVSPVSSSSLSNTNSSSSINGGLVGAMNALNLRNYDPNMQKSFLFSTIVEKDNKLKQQIERFQLLDEIIKETEKKSKYFPAASSVLSSFNGGGGGVVESPSSSIPAATTAAAVAAATESNGQVNVVDLNDIYCHFPEMCTHHLKEVEEFTKMCCQLFQLEEAINKQKSVLSGLEIDLQRELNPNSTTSQNNIANMGALSSLPNETPETLELRKEVNLSREQTRLQCKQLHDLDLRMRQNEQSLAHKEQQLQQLLEELYFQEIYNESGSAAAKVHSPVSAYCSSNSNLTVLNNTESSQFLQHQHQQQQQQQHNASLVNMEGQTGNTSVSLPNESNLFMDEANESVKQLSDELSEQEAKSAGRPVELAIRNESSASAAGNAAAASFLNNFSNRRQVRLFGDSNDDMFVASAPAPRHQPTPSLQQTPTFSTQQRSSSNSNAKSYGVGVNSAAGVQLAQLQQHQTFNGSSGNLNQGQRSLSYSNLASNNNTNSNGGQPVASQAGLYTQQIPLQVQQAQPVVAVNAKMKTSASNSYVSAAGNGGEGISLNISKTASFDVQQTGFVVNGVNGGGGGGGHHATNGYSNPKSLKLSSNLNINQLGQSGVAGVVTSGGGVVDQSGDNDSGISSMSSETTAAIMATATSSSTFHQHFPPQKHHVMAAAGNPYVQPRQLYLNGGQYSSAPQQLQQQQPQQQHMSAPYHHHHTNQYMHVNHQPTAYLSQNGHMPHQQQVMAITPSGAKSMLETLV